MYLLLDSPLRPATPDFSDPVSRALFEEHKQLAQEYFKVQTEIALLSQKKNKLLESENVEEMQSIEQLRKEKEELELLKNSLQAEYASTVGNDRRRNNDGWVMIPSRDNEIV